MNGRKETIREIIERRNNHHRKTKEEIEQEKMENKKLFNSILGKCFNIYHTDYIKILSIVEEKDDSAIYECIYIINGKRKIFSQEKKQFTFFPPHIKDLVEINEETFNEICEMTNKVFDVNDEVEKLIENNNYIKTDEIIRLTNIMVKNLYFEDELEKEDLDLTEEQLKEKYQPKYLEQVEKFKNKTLIWKYKHNNDIRKTLYVINDIDEDMEVTFDIIHLNYHDKSLLCTIHNDIKKPLTNLVNFAESTKADTSEEKTIGEVGLYDLKTEINNLMDRLFMRKLKNT